MGGTAGALHNSPSFSLASWEIQLPIIVLDKKNVTLAVKCCIYQFPGFLGKQCTVC